MALATSAGRVRGGGKYEVNLEVEEEGEMPTPPGEGGCWGDEVGDVGIAVEAFDDISGVARRRAARLCGYKK